MNDSSKEIADLDLIKKELTIEEDHILDCHNEQDVQEEELKKHLHFNPDRPNLSNSPLREHLVPHAIKKFICNVCGKTTNSSEKLEEHLLKHDGSFEMASYRNFNHVPVTLPSETPPERKEERRKTTNRSEKAVQHLLKKHDEEDMHKCEECDGSFETAKALASHRNFNHVQVILPERKEECGKVTDSSEKRVEETYWCRECNDTFGTVKALDSHRNFNHVRVILPSEKPPKRRKVYGKAIDSANKVVEVLYGRKGMYKCKECVGSFETAKALASHRSFVHVQVTLPSEQIPERKEERVEATNSSEKLEEQEKEMHKCEICCGSFETERALASHRNFNHFQVIFPSEISERKEECKKTSSSSDKKGIHKCKVCNGSFETETALAAHLSFRHVQMALPSRKVPERKELKKTNSSKKLEEDLLEHDNAWMHKCEECDGSFETAKALASHRNFVHVQVNVSSEKRPKVEEPQSPSKDFEIPPSEEPPEVKEEGFAKPVEPEQRSRDHEHVNVHKCEMCGFIFNTKSGLVSHQNSVHQNILQRQEVPKSFLEQYTSQLNVEKPHACKQCPKTFKSPYQLFIHEELDHGKQVVFPCAVCGQVFTQPDLLRKHKRQHCETSSEGGDEKSSERRIKIIYKCPKRHRPQQELVAHKNEKHVLVVHVKCEMCHKSFASQYFLNNHMKLHHHDPDAKFSCRSCRERLSFPNEPGKLVYKCDMCDKSYSFMRNLYSHKYYLHSQRSFQCENCSKQHEVPQVDLTQQKKLKAAGDDKRKQVETCQKPDCDQSPPKKTTLPRPKRLEPTLKAPFEPIVLAPKPDFPCQLCPRIFSSSVYLKKHLVSHATAKTPARNPNPCAETFKHNKNFKNVTAPGEGNLEHAAEPALACSSCGKEFAFSTRPGSTIYKCDLCDFKYRTMRNLVLHKYHVHSQRFQCPDCPKTCELDSDTDDDDDEVRRVETYDEVTVKEEPLEPYEGEIQEGVDVKGGPEEVHKR